MKPDIRSILSVFLVACLSTTTACAEPAGEQDAMMYQKAWFLMNMACTTYPAITDQDVCVDKVTRKILSERGATKERQDEIFAELARTRSERAPLSPAQQLRTEYERKQLLLAQTLVDVVDASCLIPPVIAGKNECADKVFRSIMSSRDPHSVYMNQKEAERFRQDMSGDLEGIGAEILGFTDDKLIAIRGVRKDSPAERSGILAGDRIVAIVNDVDGVKERTLSSALFPDMNALIGKIRGKPNSRVTLEILRGENDVAVTVSVTRAAIKVATVKSEILSDPKNPEVTYAHVRLLVFGSNLRAEMVRSIKDILRENPRIAGFIFDVRGNPGGDLHQVVEAVDAIADSPEAIVSIRSNQGIFAFGEDSGDRKPIPQPGDITNGLPCAVLINGGSASASEIFSGSLSKLGRCVTIGEGTWQKGTVQGARTLGDGSVVKRTTSEYLIGSPTNWVAVQCVGVQPDIPYIPENTPSQKDRKHECDLTDAVVSGGASSHPNSPKQPLAVRNPALYQYGMDVLGPIKELDKREDAKFKQILKLLKIKPKAEAEQETP